MAQEALSEDPTTNLAMNMSRVAQATSQGLPQSPEVSGAASPNYFNLADRRALETLVQTLNATPEPERKLVAAEQVLRESATEEARNATKNAASPVAVPEEFGLEASAPNVLGSRSRAQLAKATQGIAVAAVLAAVAVLFFDKDTERVATLLVALAIVAVFVAYLTTMGFGTIQMRLGPKGSTDGID